MSLSRFQALDTILNRSGFDLEYVDVPEGKISDFFGCNVFNDVTMQGYMSPSDYDRVKSAIDSGAKLSREDADTVADAMKRWAMDRGATHYTHWFQPLTGRTAEKHDSFFTLKPSGEVTEEFDAGTLVQQEPDGSSFPGGGLRSTFEARGYTAWDPSSPAFILEVGDGKTLCIPTIFVTYGGHSLDYKLPLLKSQAFLEQAAIPVCQLFDEAVAKVWVTLGWEQEYFLVDEALFNARPDLLLTGRTLLGKHSPKGQQLDDHYFGSIPERVYAYMRDLETECHKLGIPVRTRHNEVGPGQYELAPMFEEVNLAVDHNQLLMDLMDRVAHRHKLRVLLHEKPFAGVNGSGKHNNWSMSTNTGRNLLSPGKKPGQNLQFLTFFVNTIRAVYEYADILRASVASASNDHRLGANEAPPAIISVFIGETLSKVLDSIEAGITPDEDGVKQVLDLLSKVPNLELDNTDRNRTSPFAFTGNKFEIRMVGSTMNCAAPMTVMNTIVGRQLEQFHAELRGLMDNGKDRDAAILTILKRYISESKPVRFEGDGYSEEWRQEAARRGLANTPDTPDALNAYISDAAKELFTNSGVFTERELEAHYEVMNENYILKLQIEARTLGEMVINHILPAAVSYQTQLADNALKLKQLGLPESDAKAQLDLIKLISENINYIKDNVNQMTAVRRDVNEIEDANEMAKAYCKQVKPLMEAVRTYADRLEYLVDDREWPLIKYRELMFVR
ncbi:glutamine synthetase III family protein [Phaeodactylibacter luteus]|uniref:Glutamine synthetase type III n=1 Tax=Phaeodactylibacter luteus TaxID=1564516 RepID=A0A5C6RX13_9BACT|nr:glutamine synthetase III [Phaeodactylibacter luteus]TXB66525.1 glutamine synthetase type III [Phaeodactylibacter luteus]